MIVIIRRVELFKLACSFVGFESLEGETGGD
jgi:hypothetical protein